MMPSKKIKLVAAAVLVLPLIAGSGLGSQLVHQASARSSSATTQPIAETDPCAIVDNTAGIETQKVATYRVDYKERAPMSFGQNFSEMQLAGYTVTNKDGKASIVQSERKLAPDLDVTPVGVCFNIKIHLTAENRLRVVGTAGQSDIDCDDAGHDIVRETSVHFVKTIAPGDQIEIDLNNGRKITLKISPAEPK